MKKLLIINNNLHIGGVQKALVNLLGEIHDRYEITLLLFYPGGELLKDVPEDVMILPLGSCYRYLGMSKYDTKTLSAKLGRSFFAAITRVFGRKYAIRLMRFGQKKITGYDAAISYLHNGGDKAFYGGCNEFLLEHVQVEKKFTFLHGDYTLCGADTPETNARYSRFDGIIACSQGCAEAFLKVLPSLREKLTVIPNCQDDRKIRLDAQAAPVRYEDGKLHIVTVARLGREKAVPRAVEAFGALKSWEDRCHYHILGDGIERPEIEEKIRLYGLEKMVTLYGETANPYGFIEAADLLLIPSISEAAPMVIGEAVSLGTPVLSTKTSSAAEMIEEPGFGWVCENSVEGLKASLSELLLHPEQITQKTEQIRGIQLTNEAAVKKLIEIIEE